jgi:hypothetical protein
MSSTVDTKQASGVTEEELRSRDYITPNDVLNLTSITNGKIVSRAWFWSQNHALIVSIYAISFFLDFLCRTEDNIYEIEFIRFKIRDMETNLTLFEINKPSGKS